MPPPCTCASWSEAWKKVSLKQMGVHRSLAHRADYLIHFVHSPCRYVSDLPVASVTTLIAGSYDLIWLARGVSLSSLSLHACACPSQNCMMIPDRNEGGGKRLRTQSKFFNSCLPEDCSFIRSLFSIWKYNSQDLPAWIAPASHGWASDRHLISLPPLWYFQAGPRFKESLVTKQSCWAVVSLVFHKVFITLCPPKCNIS